MLSIEHTLAGDEIMQKISRAGHKVTESRRVVVELALRRTGYFSASDLYDEMKREAPTVGRATVFRTLDLLSSMHLLEKVHAGEGCHSYVICQSHHHHHLICNNCGTAVDFEDCSLSDLMQRLAQETRFLIHGHWLEVFGECEGCRQKTEEKRKSVGTV